MQRIAEKHLTALEKPSAPLAGLGWLKRTTGYLRGAAIVILLAAILFSVLYSFSA